MRLEESLGVSKGSGLEGGGEFGQSSGSSPDGSQEKEGVVPKAGEEMSKKTRGDRDGKFGRVDEAVDEVGESSRLSSSGILDPKKN